MDIKKLLKLADILDTADDQHFRAKEPMYNQADYTHKCGTPSCALGHWAAAHPETWSFRNGIPRLTVSDGNGCSAMNEFSITREMSDELFSSKGCGGANNSAEAAKYIRQFIERNSNPIF